MILLVGNKLDECDETESGTSRREVEGEEARTWAEENGLGGYVETSAKSGVGVEEVSSFYRGAVLTLVMSTYS